MGNQNAPALSSDGADCVAQIKSGSISLGPKSLAADFGEEESIEPEELAEELMKHGFAPPKRDLEAVVRACDNPEAGEEECDTKGGRKESDGKVGKEEFKKAMKRKYENHEMDLPDLSRSRRRTAEDEVLTEVEKCWDAVKARPPAGSIRPSAIIDLSASDMMCYDPSSCIICGRCWSMRAYFER